MKSASTTASGSGQKGERRAIPDDDSRMQIEDKPEVDNEERAEPPGAPSTSIRRRLAVKSEPRAVTTQEAVDGYREKAMRIESVEEIELGNIMELSITGQVLRCARQSNLSGGVSLHKADGRNTKNHRRICSAVMNERVTEDRQRSDWRRMRSCHGAEQKVNNLEKCDCENLAEEKTDEIHRY